MEPQMTLAELADPFRKKFPAQAVAGVRLTARRARFGLSGVATLADSWGARTVAVRGLRRDARCASAR